MLYSCGSNAAGPKAPMTYHDYRYGKIPEHSHHGGGNHTSAESSPVGYHGDYAYTHQQSPAQWVYHGACTYTYFLPYGYCHWLHVRVTVCKVQLLSCHLHHGYCQLAARSGYRLQSPVALVPLTYHLRYDPEFKGRKDLLLTFFPSAIARMPRATAHSRPVSSGTLFPRYVPKELAVSTTRATPAHKDPPTRPPYRTVCAKGTHNCHDG